MEAWFRLSVNNNQPRLLEKHACGNISAKYYIVLALFVTHSKWNELKEFSILSKVDEGESGDILLCWYMCSGSLAGNA